MAFKPTGGQQYYLGASIGSSDTSILLSSFLEPISETPYTMALMGTTIAYGTIAPISQQSEFISFTGITQNVDGTALLTGVTRGLGRSYPYASSSTYRLPHAGQSIFILSDSPALFDEYAAIRNDNAFLGANTVPTPSAPTQIANKAYVDSVAGGIATVNQLIIPGTAGESVVAGDVLYLKVADGFWWKADADLTATLDGTQLGIAQGTGSAAVNISGGVLLHGTDSNQSGGTIGAYGYVSNTPGKVATSAGTITRIVGQFRSATVFDFDPTYTQLPTGGQKAALAGNSGTPSSTNKYVTEAYLTSATGLPIIRTFTSSGTWTKPAGLKYIVAEVVGGGGAGGAGNNSATSGGGGGAGGYSREILAVASLGATEDYIVGAASGTSSFGTSPFLQATGGSAGDTGTAGGAGGAGGIGSNGTINAKGQGGGAGGATETGAGIGGNSYFGGGAAAPRDTDTNGNDGGAYGGGGSGATGTGSGGAGSTGVVIITEYYS